MEQSQNKILKLENFHILLWLLKDTAWVMGFKFFGVFMVLPTIGVAIYLTYKSRKERVDFFHNLAICFWIAGNSISMIGDFFFSGSWHSYATIFFLIGIVIVISYYVSNYLRRAK